MEKIPNWLRYIIAIPYGILLVIFMGITMHFTNLWFVEPDSFFMHLSTFVFRNGLNVIVFFWGLNTMLPKHRFIITLIISIIIGILYSAIQGASIMTNTMNLEYFLAFVEFMICLIISCYYSFNNKFED